MFVRSLGVSALLAGRAWLASTTFPPWPARVRSDRSLVREVRKGSESALEQLISRYWAEVARAALSIVRDEQGAQDVAQETMVSLVRNLDSFDNRRPFRPWLHRIAVNSALDWLRTQNRSPEPVADPGQFSQWPHAQSVEQDAELMEALAALTPEDRAIVVLRHILKYRSNEISEILDLPAATVRTRLARALKQLRLELGDEES